MPSRQTHKKISKLLFGTSGEETHKYMDEPVKWLGKNHRSQRHDLLTIGLLYLTKGKDAALHGLGHIAADKIFSDVENRVRRESKKVVNNLISNFLKARKF